MTPHRQLIEHDPDLRRWGDCHRTCIAAILDMDPAEVPHFCDGDPDRADKRDWLVRQDEWLQERGLGASHFAYSGAGCTLEDVLGWTTGQSRGAPMILSGRSSLGSNHSVVVMDGAIVCDPSGNGIVGPCSEGTYELTVIGIGRDWQRGLWASIAHQRHILRIPQRECGTAREAPTASVSADASSALSAAPVTMEGAASAPPPQLAQAAAPPGE